MLTKSAIRLRIILVLAIIIILNILLSKFFFRLDFTGDKRYTLSSATKNILSNLDEPVTVTGYFSENLPPHIQKTKQDFQELLIEYANRSGGNVVYEFINPNESEELEMKARQEGIQPVNINVRERDQIKQQRGYLGAKLQYGDQSETLPFVEPGASMEYALSSSIKKISYTNKSKIGFVTGHGEPPLTDMAQAGQGLGISYDAQSVALSDSSLLEDFKTLAIIAPSDTFQAADLARLDDFLATGKGLLLAINRADANLQTSTGTAITTGLEIWLEEKGVKVNEDLVTDAKCAPITVQEQQSFFTYQRQIQFPYLPIIQTFSDHPITNGLEQLILPFVSSIVNTKKDSSLTFTPLLRTSQKSGMSSLPVTFDIKKQWGDQDFVTSNLVLGAAVEGNLTPNSPSKMVVFGDGDFAVNGSGQQQQQLAPDNVNLLVNAIDWLSDDTGLNELRTKGVTSRPIQKELSDSQKQIVKIVNFLLPLFLIIIYGIIRSQRRKSKRRKWASERYT